MKATRYISATRTTNKQSGKRHYYLDGKRVSYETFAMCAIRADSSSCFSSSESKTVRRDHSLLTIKAR